MSIQQDILDTIGSDGIECSALQKAIGNIGANELDLAVNALLRARRVRVISNRYEVVPSTRPLGGMPHTGRPPSAEEEAAASLLPNSRVCVTCGPPAQALCEFRLVGPGNLRSKECNSCHGKKVRGGLTKKRGQRVLVPVNGGSGVMPTDAPSLGAAVQPDGAKPSPTSSVSTQPVIADRVFERVLAKRELALKDIAALESDIGVLRSAVAEFDQFLAVYRRFAEGVT